MDDHGTPTSARESHVLIVLTFALFAMAVRPSTVANLVYVALGLVLLALALKRRMKPELDQPEPRLIPIAWVFAMAIALSALIDVRLPPLPDARLAVWYSMAVVAIAFVATAFLAARANKVRPTLMVVLASAIALVGFLLIRAVDEQPAIDVFDLHHRSAESLIDWESPYRGLDAPSTSPNHVTGTLIDGYPYPPATLLWFSLGSLGGDARMASLVAWVITIIFLAYAGGASRASGSHLWVAVLTLLVVQPGWLFVLDQSWTEPFTLMLLVASFFYWRRSPSMSGLLLGLALFSKQYMIVLAPLLLIVPDQHRLRRLSTAAAAGLTVTLPFVVWDAQAMWDAIVVFHLETRPRADASNLAGLGLFLGLDFALPSWATLLIPATLGGLLGKRASNVSDIVLAITAALAAFFLLATQAFANYWFLVTGLLILALFTGLEESTIGAD